MNLLSSLTNSAEHLLTSSSPRLNVSAIRLARSRRGVWVVATASNAGI